jgi:xanthine dehydrogenase small subunit
MVAGATDVGLWVTKHMRKLETVIYLGKVTELKQIEVDGDDLMIGAAVTYSDASQAITERYPAFLPLIERLGAAQVRNAGTVGGNIANGSPIGDMPPGLIALGARLVLRSSGGKRVIDLENFFVSYGNQDLRSGECVEQIIIPTAPEKQIFSTYKISKRFEQDISAVCAAFAMQIEDGVIVNTRVCYGGMAEIPRRATCCEHALNGSNWNQDTISNAMQALLNDFTPLTDMRASEQYRMQVAQNLLQRFYLENSDNPYPVRLGLRYSTVYQNPGITNV